MMMQPDHLRWAYAILARANARAIERAFAQAAIDASMDLRIHSLSITDEAPPIHAKRISHKREAA
jgi:hypothetical protein